MKHLPLVRLTKEDSDWFTEKVTTLLRLLEGFVADETDALFVTVPIDRDKSLSCSLRAQTRKRFGLLESAYEIVAALEKRIGMLARIPESRLGDAYSVTGWPWSDNQDLPDLSVSPLLQADPLSPQLVPAEFKSIRGKYRFEMKLSHYLHSGVERYASALRVAPSALCRYLSAHAMSSEAALYEYASSIASLSLGVAFGRWDLRLATGDAVAPPYPDPFSALPRSAPGQLRTADGLAMTKDDLAGIRDYPIEIPRDGILVDDPGHAFDLERRIHLSLQVIWKDQWEIIEREMCDILGMKSLRDYFRKPSAFFAHHLKGYSRSRRQAPVYWPISSSKGGYTLWIYYHRLTDQTLHSALADFVNPKIAATERALGEARDSNHRDVDELSDLLGELLEFRSDLERVIGLPWKPSLNDGVLVTASRDRHCLR
jgi:hypothetical protein